MIPHAERLQLKAVILAGDDATATVPLAASRPVAMFPVLNRPLLEHTIEFLKNIGVRDIGIVVGPGTTAVQSYFGSGERLGVRLSYALEDGPRGTAGALRLFGDFVRCESFLLLSGAMFLGGKTLADDIAKAWRNHVEDRYVATALMRLDKKGPVVETAEEAETARRKRYRMVNLGWDRRAMMRFSGIYIFGGQVMDFVPEGEYMDVVEQLLPALDSKGACVQVFPLKDGRRRTIESVRDYYQLNRSLLLEAMMRPESVLWDGSYQKIMEGIWIGRNVEIHPSAQLFAPILIADDCQIEGASQVIGPAVLGPSTVVRQGAVLRESVTWHEVTLEKGSRTSYCVVDTSTAVAKMRECTLRVVTAKDLQVGGPNLPAMDPWALNGVRFNGHRLRPLARRWLYAASKRALDLILAALGILICLPVWLVVAILIKLDSPGPIFFRQRRCGKGGEEFNMLKFRTMVANAENLQTTLAERKEVDGPVFKLRKDPRVTRLGRFLRRTSLDEIPQLINVLKGEMSLVGPRPLALEEMKFNSVWRDLRLSVKPGITGLLQVNGRSESRFHDWIQYDINYVKNQSLMLDVKILVRTVWAVIRGTGAY